MTEVTVNLVVAVFTVALLIAMSLRANRRFEADPRLPMQWWLDGKVTWTAPRPIALAFTPVLAVVCLSAIVALTAFGRTKPGQERLVVPINIILAVLFLSFHAFHLRLMRLTIRRGR